MVFLISMIASFEKLPAIREHHRDETIALAGGVFDLLHPGHIDLFKRMKAAADIAVVALSSDIRVKQRKGADRPIQPQNIRLEVVDAVRYVDYAMIAPEFTEQGTPTVQVMHALHPDIFLSSEKSWLDHTKVFELLDIKFLLVSRFSDEISTTRTIEALLRRQQVQP
jgi:cytidyltransferase-like protein